MIKLHIKIAVAAVLFIVLNTCFLADKETPQIKVQLGHSSAVMSVAFSPDGKYALSGSHDRTLKLWEVVTGKEIKTFSGHSYGVTSVAFSPDGKYALSGSWDTTMKIWNIHTGDLIYSAIATRKGEYLIWTPEGFFAGSEKLAKEAVYIVDGNKIIDIAQFYDVFYRPDLVEAKVASEDISAFAKNINLEKLIRAD